MAVLPQAQTEGTQLTIRIGLYSEDRNLQPLLASALGKEFQILSSPDEAGITRILDADECVVAILDLDVKKSPEQLLREDTVCASPDDANGRNVNTMRMLVHLPSSRVPSALTQLVT